MERSIYVNPAHGNEPFILGTLLAQGVKKRLEQEGDNVTVVMPLIYANRQERILRGYGIDDSFILDPILGDLYRHILFTSGDYKKHLRDFTEARHSTESRVRDHLSCNYPRFDAEINVGSRMSSGAPSYYAFPTILSELLEQSLAEVEMNRTFGERLLESGLSEALKFELYERVFIPSYHTFSYDDSRTPHLREISTPPLKPIVENSDRIPEHSVYCMFSGTASEIHEIMTRAQKAQGDGYNVIVPPWVEADEFQRLHPDVISNPNVERVIARAGFGTIWTCQQAGKELDAIDYTHGDDPEIYFNLRTLKRKPMLKATEKQKTDFDEMDGIEYVSRIITEDIQ